MKITKLQFVNRDAFINGTTKTFVTNPDRVMGVTDITIEDDYVSILLANRERVLIPRSAVYITCEAERCATEELVVVQTAEEPKKRGRKPNSPSEAPETIQL